MQKYVEKTRFICYFKLYCICSFTVLFKCITAIIRSIFSCFCDRSPSAVWPRWVSLVFSVHRLYKWIKRRTENDLLKMFESTKTVFFFSQDIQMWKNTKPGMTLRHYNVLVYWQRLCKKGVEHPDLTNMRRNSQLTDIMASFFPKRFRCAHISTCWSFRALHSHVALDRKRPVRNTMLEHRQHKNKCQSS